MNNLMTFLEHNPYNPFFINTDTSLSNEEKLQLVARVSADAIYDWDIEAGLTHWNHGMMTLFGYQGDTDQTHQWWEERIHPDDLTRVVDSVRRAIENQSGYWTEEYRFRRADGSYAFVVDRGYFIYHTREKPHHMIGAMVDITSRVNLAEAQVKSAVEERQRLARDLHDSVSQTLYSLTLIAEAARRFAQSGQLEQVIQQTTRLGELSQQALKEMRLLLFEMRTFTLESDGLAKAIQRRLDAVEKRSNVHAVLVVENIDRLPEKIEEGLFYLTHEALNNSLKHASANKVTISLRSIPGKLELEVADNGSGFDIRAVDDTIGMGLANMKTRARKLGAELEISSSSNSGTKIRVLVPLEDTKDACENSDFYC
jgi:PAS domain S-box-containing protein